MWVSREVVNCPPTSAGIQALPEHPRAGQERKEPREAPALALRMCFNMERALETASVESEWFSSQQSKAKAKPLTLGGL